MMGNQGKISFLCSSGSGKKRGRLLKVALQIPLLLISAFAILHRPMAFSPFPKGIKIGDSILVNFPWF